MTFLIDVNPEDIKDPLAQFNHTLPTREGLQKLIYTIKSSVPGGILKESVLSEAFETYWPKFKSQFELILNSIIITEPEVTRNADDILTEVLNSIRSFDKRLRKFEAMSPTATAVFC